MSTADASTSGRPAARSDTGSLHRLVERYGSAVIAATLGLAVLAALADGVIAQAGVGIVVAVTAVAVAWAIRAAWRRRPTAGVAALVLFVPLTGLLVALRPSDAPAIERAARAVDVTVATLVVAAAVLVFEGARRLALSRRQTGDSPWATFTSPDPTPGDGRVALRIGAAGLLMVAAAMLLVALAPRGFAGVGTSWAGLLVLVALTVAAIVVAPALAAAAVVASRDRAERERALHRQAVAAHLHDSVLQTFALVQRRLDDPHEVRRLIRRQERELRDWLAGREQLWPDTLAGALREVVDEVEADLHVPIDLEVLGDCPVDAPVASLIDATREALRNAARHGDGAPIRVLVVADTATTEVYVRDEGPGFVLDRVPIARRGVRDAIVGRMAAVGGTATIDSELGSGTEVVLRLPPPKESTR